MNFKGENQLLSAPSYSPLPWLFCCWVCLGLFSFHFTVSQRVWGNSEAYFYFILFQFFSSQQTLYYMSFQICIASCFPDILIFFCPCHYFKVLYLFSVKQRNRRCRWCRQYFNHVILRHNLTKCSANFNNDCGGTYLILVQSMNCRRNIPVQSYQDVLV